MKFLDQASGALTFASPTVSSFLRATRRDALVTKDTSAQGNFCNACGQMLLLGWSCEPVRSIEHRQTRQQRINGVKTAKKRVRCSACGTEDSIQHHKRAKAKIIQRPSQLKENLSKDTGPKLSDIHKPIPDPAPAPVAVTSASSKEQTPEPTQAKPTARRKGRGKNSSLQAMLANKKTETPKGSGFGLDFMDFMK